jgi:hypothetical protein
MNTYLASSNLSKWRRWQRDGGGSAGGDRRQHGRGGGGSSYAVFPPGAMEGFLGGRTGGTNAFLRLACVGWSS